MLYAQTNVTKCCEATICMSILILHFDVLIYSAVYFVLYFFSTITHIPFTGTECYLQIRTPKKEKNTACPFCNCPKLVTSVQKSMDEDAIAKREEEEQRVIESIIRNRAAQVNGEMPSSPSSESDEQSNFGSSLEQYNRSRTFSNSSTVASEASSDGSRTPVKQTNDDNALLSLAMSPDARLQLEEEMAAQLSHETHQRMESEAEEERMRHVEEWSRSDSGVRSRMREARIAELTNLLERMTSDTRERGQDLAGIFSALESGRGGNRGAALENLMRLEAAFLNATGEERTQQSFQRGLSERFGSTERQNGFSLSSPRRIVRAMPRRGVSTTHMETAEMLMRGISEEEQLAMAISMSMAEESNRQQQQQPNEEHQDGQQDQRQHEVVGEGDHAQPTVLLETNEVESESSSSSDSSHTDITDNEGSTPALADGEEQVVFETE